MSRLVLLNGVPGTGKSTLARLYADRHPLTLALDVDVVRSMLGAWLEQPTEAGLIARRMALEVARVQLSEGRDVIVAQYLGRLDFVRQLEELAVDTVATFIEIVLTSDMHDAAARFQRRTAQPQTPAHVDAARLLERSGGAAELLGMHRRLIELVRHRTRTIEVESVDGQVEAAYDAIVAAITARSDETRRVDES